MQYLTDIINKLYTLPSEELTEDALHATKKNICKNYDVKDLPTNIQLFQMYNQLLLKEEIEANDKIKWLLVKRKVRSLSGIVPIQVLTKAWPCPGKCIFCPDEAIMPKSYISTEPGAMRALLNKFDPIKQVYNRLLSLQLTWHDTDKIEMIVLGGSWDAYTEDYKIEFTKALYDACNTFDEYKKTVKVDISNPRASRFSTMKDFDIDLSSSLEEAQEINETASCRIIGFTIETRPDLVTEKNIRKRRELGVTRIEMWVQSLFDEVLLANKRWHDVETIKTAFHLMRKYGLKISAHIMFGLHHSSVEKDLETFTRLFKDPYLRPDELKVYPTSVIPNTELYRLYKEGKYTAITQEEIEYIITEIKQNIIPPYTRIKRLIRDIPATEIVAGSNVTNLRQIVVNKLKKSLKEDEKLQENYQNRLYLNEQNLNIDYLDLIYSYNDINSENTELFEKFIWEETEENFETLIIWKDINLEKNPDLICLCTRCREIRNRKDNKETLVLIIRKYKSSVWEEYFISLEDYKGYLYGFTRLLLPYEKEYADCDWLGKDTGIIRELHVYGQLEKIWRAWKNQHRWFGTQLMNIAEFICKKKWYFYLSVISGIWVKKYYNKLGYHHSWTYVKKQL